MRVRVAIASIGAASLLAAVPHVAQPTEAPQEFVLSPEGNHLWAYDAATNEHQLVFQAMNGGDPGAEPTSGRRDINGQICVSPDGKHMVTGEDTVYAATGGDPDGAGSHDPRIAGWGYFRLQAKDGSVHAEQVGKLAPEWRDDGDPANGDEGYAGDPDNYGCGFLDDKRLFTTAIGNTLPGEPANGQLFLWYADFTAGYTHVAPGASSVGFDTGTVGYCEIDRTLATTGGIAIDGDDVYVAVNRFDDQSQPGGVWRYRPPATGWPKNADGCTPEFLGSVTKTLVIPLLQTGTPVPDPMAPTPSSVVVSPADTLFVSSVFSGTVSEYTKDGRWIRDVYPLSPVAPRTGPTSNTPYGLAFTSDGALWIADLGIVVAAPASGQGSLIKVEPGPFGTMLPPETVRDGLTFPDGLGVYRPEA